MQTHWRRSEYLNHTVKPLVRIRVRLGGSIRPPKLWLVLAVRSIGIFVAWPFSDLLSFEMTPDLMSRSPVCGTSLNVMGFSYANFNKRHVSDPPGGAGRDLVAMHWVCASSKRPRHTSKDLLRRITHG